MKHIIFLLFFGNFVTNLYAQLQEEFSDGNFSSNPTWLGDTTHFIVNSLGTLQLNNLNPAANNVNYLVTNAPTSLSDSTTWECWIRMDFAASTTNFARVYLLANQAALNNNLNGYFLKIGGASGNTDAVELYRQDGSTTTLLAAGTAGAVGGDSIAVRLRVTRSTTGEWTLLADYTGGRNFQTEGKITDTTYSSGNFFGFYCRFTATRNKAFFFDEVRIDPLFADNTPPQLLQVNALNATQLEVVFDEALDSITAADPTHYSIEPDNGKPINAVLTTPNTVRLTWNTPLQSAVNYTLTVSGIKDKIGNESQAQGKAFIFYNIQAAAPGDILISEIFADPTPSQGLPDAEFVELYNRSNKGIQLENFGFSTGSTPQKLPAFLLLPGQYVLVCDDSDVADFERFGKVIALGSFPALTNSADDVTLTDANGQVIFAISYTDDWYQDTEKAAGGWSLELIDLQKNPQCEGNWRASIHENGGTPGTQNSLFGTVADTIAPELVQAVVENETHIVLRFSETLDPNTAEEASHYSINSGTIAAAALQTFDQVLLTLTSPLQKGQLYTVIIGNQVTDCLGNGVGANNTLQLGIAEAIQPGDVVLNEVLFNPQSGGSDFIELYNLSSKILNLKGLQILNTQKTGSTSNRTIADDFLLLPNSYVAITEAPQDLRDRYNPPAQALFLSNGLPSLDDDVGNVTLRMNGITIDSFDYSDDLHFALLSDQEGVSLERISFTASTQGVGNWHSAAAAVHFATPGYRNSQFVESSTATNGVISIVNNTFSPDGDGFEDFLLLEYQIDQPGSVANIRIFDANGRLVKKLVQNEILAASGSFKWDGLMEDNSKARLGIYVVWIEIVEAKGSVKQEKRTCVLAGKLK